MLWMMLLYLVYFISLIKHLLQVYPIQSNAIQYYTELCKSHCYYDSLSTKSTIKK